MKKQENGFTLIELLAVIVILAIIALIAVPVIMNIISKANKSAFKDSAYGIIKAGELYYSEKLLDVDGMTSDKNFEFPEAIGLDLKGSRPTSGAMKISIDGKIALAISNGKYCIRKEYNDTDVTIDENIDTCILTKELNPIITTNNTCLTSGTCSNGTKLNIKVNENENYDFYVIKDESNELTLVMDRNLGGKVAWYKSSRDNSKGPLTALAELKARTNKWTNIGIYSYTLVDDKPDEWGSTVRYQAISGVDEVTNVRARLLTYKETAALGCTAASGSCPTWLSENLSSSNTEEEPYGYWLSTSYSGDVISGLRLHFDGRVDGYNVDIYENFGIRPVIKISKTV